MLAIKNLDGEVFLLTGASNIVRKRRVNGEKELSLKLDKTVQNANFFDDLDKLWRVIDFSGEEYPILIYRDVAEGNGYTREINCLHSFFDDMRNHVIYETFTGSKTFAAMMDFIFAGSGYTYNIIDQFFANDFENFGDDYGLELFKTALERYVAEFTVSGKTVTLRAQIGNTTDFQYRHKFNLESIERDVDALDFSTYGEGFGKDGLRVTYRSPLADIYGKRPIKAIRDERFTIADNLTATVKEAVDTSLKIALTVKLSDLRASGYNKNHPNEGDTIILVDERLGLKVDTRIVEIVEALDKKGNVLDCDVTLSNYSNIFEQQRRIHNATKTIADAIDGKRPLPFEALAIAVQQATIALQNAQTELEFPDNGGILAISKTNPNHFVLFNSAGVGISTDAGQTFKTAITASGIVADVVTAGTLRGIIIEGVEIIGSIIRSADEGTEFYVEGGNMILSRTNGRKVTVNPDGVYGLDGAGAVTFQADRQMVTSGILGTNTQNAYIASYGETRIVDFDDVPGDGEIASYLYLPLRAKGFYGNFVEVNAGENGNNLYLRPRSGGEVRITGAGTIDAYYPLRAGAIFSNNFISTTTSLWMGTDSAMHVVNKGYVEESTGSPIYRDVYANDIYNRAMITMTTNAYIGTDEELRVVNKGLTDIYRDVRASVYRGIALDLDGTTTAEHLYIRPSATGSVRITSRGTTDSFRPIEASEFNVASSIFYKKNIEDYTGSATSLINDTPVRLYHLNEDIDEIDHKRVGLLVQESPIEIINMKTGDSIDIYAMASLLWKSAQESDAKIQQQQQQIDAQQQQLSDFATLTEALTNRLTELESRVAQLEA